MMPSFTGIVHTTAKLKHRMIGLKGGTRFVVTECVYVICDHIHVRADFPPKLLSCAHNVTRPRHAQHSHCMYFVLWLKEREIQLLCD